jgi:hypothetical protein
MKKTQMLYDWLKQQKEWLYLFEIPHENFGMSKAQASTTLINLCKQGKCDFRISRMKQYRVRP